MRSSGSETKKALVKKLENFSGTYQLLILYVSFFIYIYINISRRADFFGGKKFWRKLFSVFPSILHRIIKYFSLHVLSTNDLFLSSYYKNVFVYSIFWIRKKKNLQIIFLYVQKKNLFCKAEFRCVIFLFFKSLQHFQIFYKFYTSRDGSLHRFFAQYVFRKGKTNVKAKIIAIIFYGEKNLTRSNRMRLGRGRRLQNLYKRCYVWSWRKWKKLFMPAFCNISFQQFQIRKSFELLN